MNCDALDCQYSAMLADPFLQWLSPMLAASQYFYDIMQAISFLIATVTLVCSAYTTVIMIWWWRRLKGVHSKLRPFFLAAGLIMSGLAYWAATNMFQMIAFDVNLPTLTLPVRLFLMIGAMIKVYVTLYYYGGGAIMPEVKEEKHIITEHGK